MKITTLFLDIGGVLLTNGWDRHARERAARSFGLDPEEMTSRQDIYRLALDVAQVPAEQVLYIEDRPMFVQVAEELGIRGIHHQSLESTRGELATLGLI